MTKATPGNSFPHLGFPNFYNCISATYFAHSGSSREDRSRCEGAPCSQHVTAENILDHFCRADFGKMEHKTLFRRTLKSDQNLKPSEEDISGGNLVKEWGWLVIPIVDV